MARTKKNTGDGGTPVSSFQHGDAARLNIPEATETQAGLSKGKKRVYRYSPHLSPKLQFDSTGKSDKAPTIIEKVLAGQKLTDDETEILRSIGQQNVQPWLEWATKQEQEAKKSFTVDDVVLHIHERVSAQAILATARRQDIQEQDFFARPKLHQEQALQYYHHNMDWVNRLILGDSLQVMNSLANRENLAGQVQMIYIDPPYGIKFSSNWQNEVDSPKDVGDAEEDVTREPEMIKAYRDTWMLGTHSYLTYLKQRLLAAHSLLHNKGSVFVQISHDNVHRVRLLLDEVFQPENFVSQINFRTAMTKPTKGMNNVFDYVLWYAKDKSQHKYRDVYEERETDEEESHHQVQASVPQAIYPFEYNGTLYNPKNGWRVPADGLARLAKSERLYQAGKSPTKSGTLKFKKLSSDFGMSKLDNTWNQQSSEQNKIYVVQTSIKIIQRCVLMTTDPGDLVLDPTCGSGTTSFVSEQWGRRWITIDSSRVALALARQRLLTASFDAYRTKDPAAGVDPTAPQNPAFGFYYDEVPHITSGSIAQNSNLDPIFAKHEPILAARLSDLNTALSNLLNQFAIIQTQLVEKLRQKYSTEGGRALTEEDLRRWLLPGTPAAMIDFGTPSQRGKWKEAIPAGKGWQEWEVPFDTDPVWPVTLQTALTAFRTAWKEKMNEVNQQIKSNADKEELVNSPKPISSATRVSGPFSVEGVRPEELTLGEDGRLYDPTANSFDETGTANADGYIDLMISLIRKDGVTFLGNRRAEFESLEKEAGKSFHARGRWKGKEDTAETVAVVFGPQYGPINAPMAVEAIESAKGLKEVNELVIAGFSFDSAAQEKAKEMDSPELRIHLAHIRPDVSPGMQGLLKETANSQLFTVFGQPDIRVVPADAGQVKVEMNGVCIYNPLTGAISESSRKKVAAWFLDADYDGRCFCISQAFFPDKDAWAKIAKALGSSVSEGAFEEFTTSWPFKPGKHNRIAVKVIDPRGNEVMAIQTLKS